MSCCGLIRAAKLVLLSVVVACTDEYKPIEVENVRPSVNGGELQPTAISSRVHSPLYRIATGRMQRPFAIYALGDTLAVVLDRAFPFMHLLNTQRGMYLQPLMGTSSADVQPFAIHRIAVSPHNPLEFAAYDLIGSSISYFRVGVGEQPLILLRELKLKGVEAIDWPVWHTGDALSVELVREDALRAFIDVEGGLGEPTGISLSSFGPSWAPPNIRRDAAEGQTCVAPDRNRMARSFLYTGLMLLLDTLGNQMAGTTPDIFFEPQFVVHDSREVVFGAQTGGARVGYRSCAATNTVVVGLFSGMNFRQGGSSGRGRLSSGARQIHVFDWSGRLLRGFRMEREAVWLDVTADGKRILVLEGGVTSAVVAYPL